MDLDDFEDKWVMRPEVVCADGFKLSVQASAMHYSEPRDHCERYDRVEVGFPSSSEELLMPYAENPEKPTATVYPYTPIQVVMAVIAKHGGPSHEMDGWEWTQPGVPAPAPNVD